MNNEVIGIDISQENNINILYSTRTETKLWDLRAPEPVTIHQYGFINKCCLDAQGLSVGLSTEEGFLAIWDIRAMKSQTFLQADMMSTITSMTFSHSGDNLACGYRNGTVILRERTEDWNVKREFSPIPHPVSSLRFYEPETLFIGSHGCLARSHLNASEGLQDKVLRLENWGSSFVSETAVLDGNANIAVFSHRPLLRCEVYSIDHENESWNTQRLEELVEKETMSNVSTSSDTQDDETVFKKPQPVPDIKEIDVLVSLLRIFNC